MPRDRNEKGRYTSGTQINETDLINAVAEFEPASTREVADAVGIPRRSTLRYLNDMAENDEVQKKKLDPRRVVWMQA